MPSAAPKPNPSRWTFSLRTFLVVSLTLSLVLGYVGRVWWKAYRDSQPPTLYELAQIAKRHGMPMPPKEAKLVLGSVPSRTTGLDRYSPVFLLKEYADGGCDLLDGFELQTLDPPTDRASWREFLLDPTREDQDWTVSGNLEGSFICAVQLADRGEKQQAEELLRCVLDREAENKFDDYDAIDPSDLRTTMARCIYRHLAPQLRKQPDAWAELRVRLEALQEEFPKLHRESCGDVCRDLALAVDAPAPPANSVEALLIDWSRRELMTPFSDPFGLLAREGVVDDSNSEVWTPQSTDTAPAREIILRGFAAVPELIALRDDRRLTAHNPGFERVDGVPKLRRLGDLAEDLLKEISGLADTLPLSVPVSDEELEPDAAAWQRWLAQAEAQGEREYFRRNVFARGLDGVVLRVAFIRILARKFPETIPDLCRQWASNEHERFEAVDFSLAVAAAKLPREDRIRLLVELFERAPPDNAPWILCSLAKLDQARTTELLLPLLAECPADVEQSYGYCAEALLADVVVRVDDLRAWQALLVAARRASVGLRRQFLANTTDEKISDANRLRRIALFAAFLEDETVWDTSVDPSKFLGEGGAPPIAIRDYAADSLAWMLDSKRHATWREPHTPEQWSALRAQVRERLKQEELPELE